METRAGTLGKPSRAMLLLASYLALLLLLYSIPSFVLEMGHPLASWNYLGSNFNYQGFNSKVLFHSPTKWNELLPELKFNIFSNVVFRPSARFITDLCYLLFGGEFWAFDLLRWIAKIVTALCIFDIVRHIGKHKILGVASAALFFFHPIPSEADTFAADAWTALGLAGLWWFAARGFSARSIVWVGAVFLLLVGSKEIGGGLALLTLPWLAGQARAEKHRSLMRWSLFAVGLLFCLGSIYRVLVLTIGGPIPFSLQAAVGRSEEYTNYMLGYLNYGPWFWMISLLTVIAVVIAFMEVRKFLWNKFPSIDLLFAAALLSIIAVHSAQGGILVNVNARYAISAVVPWSILLGLGAAKIPRTWGRIWLAVMLLLPLTNGYEAVWANIRLYKMHSEFANHLQIQQAAAEARCAIRIRDNGDERGVYPEEYRSVINYFGKVGRSFYPDVPNEGVVELSENDRSRDCISVFSDEGPQGLGVNFPFLTHDYFSVLFQDRDNSVGFMDWVLNFDEWIGRMLGNPTHFFANRNREIGLFKTSVFVRKSAPPLELTLGLLNRKGAILR